jgi:hypothetical protein
MYYITNTPTLFPCQEIFATERSPCRSRDNSGSLFTATEDHRDRRVESYTIPFSLPLKYPEWCFNTNTFVIIITNRGVRLDLYVMVEFDS